MNGTLTLKNPVMINGDKITEMKYDTNEIDGVLFATAEAKRKAAAGMKNLSVSAAAEFDFGLHLYLGYAAIVAVNPTYDFSDLERMKGADVVEVMALGGNFYAEIRSRNHRKTTPQSLPRLRQSLPHQHDRARKKASN